MLNRWTHSVFHVFSLRHLQYWQAGLCNHVFKFNHFARVETQVLKCCFWRSTDAGTSVTTPACNQTTTDNIHKNNSIDTKQRLHKTQGHLRSLGTADHICEVQAPQYQQQGVTLNSSVPLLNIFYVTALRSVKNMKYGLQFSPQRCRHLC